MIKLNGTPVLGIEWGDAFTGLGTFAGNLRDRGMSLKPQTRAHKSHRGGLQVLTAVPIVHSIFLSRKTKRRRRENDSAGSLSLNSMFLQLLYLIKPDI